MRVEGPAFAVDKDPPGTVWQVPPKTETSCFDGLPSHWKGPVAKLRMSSIGIQSLVTVTGAEHLDVPTAVG
jgi:hypothetical protein